MFERITYKNFDINNIRDVLTDKSKDNMFLIYPGSGAGLDF